MKIAELWSRYDRDYLPDVRDAIRPRAVWKTHLGPVFGGLARLDTARVNAYTRMRLEQHASRGTIAREMGVLVACLRWGFRGGLIDRVPFIARPSTRGSPRIVSGEDVGRLLAVDHPYSNIVRMALLTGQRRGALLDLTWDRVREDLGMIDFRTPDVFAAERMKGRAVVPITGELGVLVQRLKASASGRFVLHEGGHAVEWSDKKWQTLCRKAEVKANFHMLRHTVATGILNRGGRLEEASRLLGHKSIKTTQAYYWDDNPSFLKGAVNGLTLEGYT